MDDVQVRMWSVDTAIDYYKEDIGLSSILKLADRLAMHVYHRTENARKTPIETRHEEIAVMSGTSEGSRGELIRDIEERYSVSERTAWRYLLMAEGHHEGR